jgi:hypothetical protein
LLGGAGIAMLRVALKSGRRLGLLSRTFWQTFPQYPGYRVRRVWPAAAALAGLILLICGAVFVFRWILAYYAARLGHPVS